MRIVYMGTPDFAVEPLARMYDDGHDIACVVTKPDKPRNRGMKVSYSPVKEYAIARGTAVYQPDTLRDGALEKTLREQRCDLIVVVAYGKLLPGEILDIPVFGCLNIHGSLLPKYKGAAPIQWAVLNGETETGVTAMFMTEELDAGDILGSVKTPIGEDETAGELSKRLSVIGADLLSESVRAIEKNTAYHAPQDFSEATFAPPMRKYMSPIDWTHRAHRIKCKVRGLNPWPVATAELDDGVFRVFSVDISDTAAGMTPGSVISAGKQGIEIACADGAVTIKELQAPGGKRMPAAEYLRGHNIRIEN